MRAIELDVFVEVFKAFINFVNNKKPPSLVNVRLFIFQGSLNLYEEHITDLYMRDLTLRSMGESAFTHNSMS